VLVIGVDGGGTSTRCVVATAAGEIVGRGRAGGSNPRSSPDAGGALAAAVAGALVGVPADEVACGVFGLAGAGAAGRETALRLARAAWTAAGLAGEPLVVPDIEVAYAAGTAEPAGSVLIAGTGAVAARIADRVIAARADGAGWLLGDEGSGVWIGIRAASAALAAMDGRGPATRLAELVPAALGVAAEPQAIVAAVYAAPPSALGALAPVVLAAADDAVAISIVARAAAALVETVAAVAGEGPVVLAGGLIEAETPVSVLVKAALADRKPVVARDGAAGAAALALHATGTPTALAAHRELVSSAH